MRDVFIDQATQLIDKKSYKEALDVLFSLWKSTPDSEIAARILEAYRGQRNYAQFQRWAENFSQRFPDDDRIQELVKDATFDKSMSDINRTDNVDEAAASIEKMIREDDLNPYQVNTFCFQLIKKAKQTGKWQLARAWYDKIDPTLLNEKSPTPDMSPELMRYYLSGIDIAEHLQNREEALTLSEHLIDVYPDANLARKKRVKVLIHQNELEKAKALLEELINWNRPNWFYVEQLAVVHSKMGNLDEAWRLACVSFNTRGEQRHKLELHLIISHIAEARGYHDMARDFKTLSALIRAENEMNIPQHLIDHVRSLSDTTITAPDILSTYRDQIIEGINIYNERFQGEIVWFPPDKNIARVKYNKNKNIIIRKTELEEDCQYEGAKIQFYIDTVTDSKTGKPIKVGRFGTKLHKID